LPRFPAQIRHPANLRGEFSGFSAAKLRMIPRAAQSIFLLIDIDWIFSSKASYDPKSSAGHFPIDNR
jgi:hypothetical protein